MLACSLQRAASTLERALTRAEGCSSVWRIWGQLGLVLNPTNISKVGEIRGFRGERRVFLDVEYQCMAEGWHRRRV